MLAAVTGVPASPRTASLAIPRGAPVLAPRALPPRGSCTDVPCREGPFHKPHRPASEGRGLSLVCS